MKIKTKHNIKTGYIFVCLFFLKFTPITPVTPEDLVDVIGIIDDEGFQIWHNTSINIYLSFYLSLINVI